MMIVPMFICESFCRKNILKSESCIRITPCSSRQSIGVSFITFLGFRIRIYGCPSRYLSPEFIWLQMPHWLIFLNVWLQFPSSFTSLRWVLFGTSQYQNRKSITSPSPYSPLSLTLLLPGSRLDMNESICVCTHAHAISKAHDGHTHSSTHELPLPSCLVEILLTAAFRMKFHYSSVQSQESYTNIHTQPTQTILLPLLPPAPFRLWME